MFEGYGGGKLAKSELKKSKQKGEQKSRRGQNKKSREAGEKTDDGAKEHRKK